MRWSIIKLIWERELRDQLRDRRTVFMIAVLPILLYPVAGLGVMEVWMGFLSQPAYVGVVGAEHLPSPTPDRLAGPLRPRPWPPLLLREGEGLSFPDRYLDQGKQAGKLVVKPLPTTWPAGRGEEALEQLDRSELAARRVAVLLVVPPDFVAQLDRGEQASVYLVQRERDEQSKMAAR